MSPETSTNPIDSAEKTLKTVRAVHRSASKLSQLNEQPKFQRFVNKPFGQSTATKDTWVNRLHISDAELNELDTKLSSEKTFEKLNDGTINPQELADYLEYRVKTEALLAREGTTPSDNYNPDDIREVSYLKTTKPSIYVEAVSILAERTNAQRSSAETTSRRLHMIPIINFPLIFAEIGLGAAYDLGMKPRPNKESERYAYLAAWARSEIPIPKEIKPQRKPKERKPETKTVPSPRPEPLKTPHRKNAFQRAVAASVAAIAGLSRPRNPEAPVATHNWNLLDSAKANSQRAPIPPLAAEYTDHLIQTPESVHYAAAYGRTEVEKLDGEDAFFIDSNNGFYALVDGFGTKDKLDDIDGFFRKCASENLSPERWVFGLRHLVKIMRKVFDDEFANASITVAKISNSKDGQTHLEITHHKGTNEALLIRNGEIHQKFSELSDYPSKAGEPITTSKVNLNSGDIVLLLSSGTCAMIGNPEITSLIGSSAQEPKAITDALLNLAREGSKVNGLLSDQTIVAIVV